MQGWEPHWQGSGGRKTVNWRGTGEGSCLVGELEQIFCVFGGGVCQGVKFWSGSGGGGDFVLAKIKLVRSWWGKYRNGGKISFRGNGREFRRKGPSQLTLCAGSDHSFSDQAYIFLLLRIFESRD